MRNLLVLSSLLAVSAAADTLMPLGDEFNDAATFSRWRDLDETEGWVLSSDESADINTSAPGQFRIVPKAMGWFMNLRGVLYYKEVTGDFIATMKVRVSSRHNPANPGEVPNRLFSLTGIFIHEPRPYITHAAPVPYRTDAVWPPAAFGSDYVPNTENYVFLSYGTAGNPGTRQFEIKTTRNSDSRLYYGAAGINQASSDAWMQIVRAGNTVVCLRKYAENGAWIVENRYPNTADLPLPAFGPTLQVGITAYTDWQNSDPYYNGGIQGIYHFNCARPTAGQPDMISDTDYFRLQRPDPALTESVLQAMSVSYTQRTVLPVTNPPVFLSASPAAAPWLGDNANVPLGTVAFGSPSFSGQEGGSIAVTVSRSGASLNRPLSLSWQTVPGSAGSADFTPQSGTLTWTPNDPAQKTILVPVAADASIEGPEAFSLTLSGLDGPATFPASAPALTAPLTITEHPFDQWRSTQFGANANSLSAGANADPDNDGLDNLMEHVFGTNPLAAADTGVLPAAVHESGRPGIRFSCPVTPGVRLEVQQSVVIGAWQPAAVRAAGAAAWTATAPGFSVAAGSGGEIRVLAPASAPRLFLRLAAVVE